MKQMKKYLAAGLFAVLVILQAVSLYQLNSLKRDNRELQEKAAVAESRYQELEQMQTELQDLATEIKLAERNQSAQDTWVEPEKRVLRIDGQLYYGTAETGPMGDSGVVRGMILSSVGENEIPEKDACSNFGCIGNAFTDASGEMVMVAVGEEWFIFRAK